MKKKLRILIVDDNPRARGALSAFLSTMDGVNVSGEASNGEEALVHIEQRPPDIVLMDIQMPVMDGLQATRLIKTRWRQVKIIVLTMYPNYEMEAKEAGADAVLIKGCQAEEMKTTIRLLAAKPTGMSPAINTFVLYREGNERI